MTSILIKAAFSRKTTCYIIYFLNLDTRRMIQMKGGYIILDITKSYRFVRISIITQLRSWPSLEWLDFLHLQPSPALCKSLSQKLKRTLIIKLNVLFNHMLESTIYVAFSKETILFSWCFVHYTYEVSLWYCFAVHIKFLFSFMWINFHKCFLIIFNVCS